VGQNIEKDKLMLVGLRELPNHGKRDNVKTPNARSISFVGMMFERR